MLTCYNEADLNDCGQLEMMVVDGIDDGSYSCKSVCQCWPYITTQPLIASTSDLVYAPL